MKKFFTLLCCLAALAACQPQEPDRAPLEQYAKEHMENPASYEFANLSMRRDHTFLADLAAYKSGLEKLAAQAPDPAPYRTEIDKVEDLMAEFGTQVACYDRTLYFWFLGGSSGQMKLQQFVIGRFSPDGRLLEVSMDPDEFSTYPALQILKDRGLL
ncbi:MAG: hypothetical protein IJV37_02435 [Bacteroidales bacterium]|nr:hypothetical protein [Bacteroidales bacterium]